MHHPALARRAYGTWRQTRLVAHPNSIYCATLARAGASPYLRTALPGTGIAGITMMAAQLLPSADYLYRAYQMRYFWWSLVINDLKNRYRHSFLGIAWSLGRPI